MDKTVVKFTYCTVLPVSFNSPNINIFLLQEITNCVFGGIKENEVGRSTSRNNQKHLNWKKIILIIRFLISETLLYSIG